MQALDQTDALISGGKIRGTSPRDGAALAPVGITPPDEIVRVVATAREAQRVWSEHPPRDRARRLEKLRPLLLERAEAFAAIMAEEQGKSIVEAYASEILPSANLFPYWATQAPKLLVPDAETLHPINFPKKAGVVELKPRGVIGLIAPWNFPLGIPLRALVPALAAGNAVVLKPSEYAPRVGAEIVALFDELSVPGLIGLVQGGPDAGEKLIGGGVDHVVFTGSIASGRKVARLCADLLVGYTLELGGKDAALILADADIERAVEGTVWASFGNAGQNCAAVERVYVVEAVAQRFIDKVVERTRQLTVGGNGKKHYDVGPMVRASNLKIVETHIEDAIKGGATVRTGGKATGVGLHFAPTVLTDVDDDMAVMTEETFGPVMPIAVVRDEEEAVARANRSVYGLTASIWTRDIERGRKLAARLKTGVVTINNHAFTSMLPHAPWHGRGQSGGGITNSRFAFYDLVEPHYVLVDRNKSKEMWWFPHNEAIESMVRAMATLFGGGGSKIAAALRVVASFPKRWK